MKSKAFFLVLIAAAIAYCTGAKVVGNDANEAERPKLQIINGTDAAVDVFWLKPEGGRTPNGSIEAGKNSVISTTLGHRFAVVSRNGQDESIVSSEVPVQAYRFGGIPEFYTQRASAGGFPIVASSAVSPFALQEAVYIVDKMLAERPDVRDAMVKSGARLCILAHNEFTTDQPEWAWLAEEPVPGFPSIEARDYRDARARGMGGSATDPYCSCAEENLLAYDGDPYSTENILIHELAHNIHLRGMNNVDATFDGRVRDAYQAAMSAGLWKGKYASVNHHEYFAEGVQSWFDNNREDDHDHNHVNTRKELIDYDLGLATLCEEVFGDTEFRYTKPNTRLVGHLSGYDPSKAPRFQWPPRLKLAKQLILEKAVQRSDAGDDQTAGNTETPEQAALADQFSADAFREIPTDRKPAPVMDGETIRKGLESHDQALFVKAGWIRDPYIVLGPDDFYYLTGTQPREGDVREIQNPYNIGLGDESIVGNQVRVWRSKNLIEWESLGAIFSVADTVKANAGQRIKKPFIWAPEVHWLGDRWALVHCPKNHSSLAITRGEKLEGPWIHPMGSEMGERHDPSIFTDTDGKRYLLWGNTFIAPLSDDLSRYTDKPARIDPSSYRDGPDGKQINRIGHEGATMIKVGGKYVHLGTAWSTDRGRKGSYNLYYCVADEITGPYGPRKFAGRFLGHGTPFQDRDGKWWCTAFFNANVPPLPKEGVQQKNLAANAQTINEQGVTIVPLDVRLLDNGEVHIRAKDPAYAVPGPDESEDFNL